MKKTTIAIALLLSSTWIGAASLTAGGKTKVNNSNPVSPATAGDVSCDMIAGTETANIQLSKDVTGDLACTATSAGIGTKHPQGKGVTYGASSNGGKLTESTTQTVSDMASAMRDAS